MGCCFIPARILTRLSRPPGRAASVSTGRGEWGSVCIDFPHYWPVRPPLTPRQRRAGGSWDDREGWRSQHPLLLHVGVSVSCGVWLEQSGYCLESSVLLGSLFLCFGRGQAFALVRVSGLLTSSAPRLGSMRHKAAPQHCSWGSRVFISPLLRVFLFVFYFTSRGKCAHSTFTRAEVWLLSHFIRI